MLLNWREFEKLDPTQKINTLEMIANEKAGIFKQNSKIIIGERNGVVDEIFVKKAKELSSSITFVSDLKD